jgi:hypothetical protein
MVDELPFGEGSAPLSGDKAIEDAAITFVLDLECQGALGVSASV